jgi:hypothetical protein
MSSPHWTTTPERKLPTWTSASTFHASFAHQPPRRVRIIAEELFMVAVRLALGVTGDRRAQVDQAIADEERVDDLLPIDRLAVRLSQTRVVEGWPVALEGEFEAGAGGDDTDLDVRKLLLLVFELLAREAGADGVQILAPKRVQQGRLVADAIPGEAVQVGLAPDVEIGVALDVA